MSVKERRMDSSLGQSLFQHSNIC